MSAKSQSGLKVASGVPAGDEPRNACIARQRELEEQERMLDAKEAAIIAANVPSQDARWDCLREVREGTASEARCHAPNTAHRQKLAW